MQIQSLPIAVAPSRFAAGSLSSTSPRPVEQSSAAPVSGGNSATTVVGPEASVASVEVLAFRQALEDVFRSRIGAVDEVRGRDDEHEGDDDERRGVRHGLRDVRKVVKQEIKQLGRDLKEFGKVEEDESGNEEIQDLRHSVKDIGKQFDRALKSLERDVRHNPESTDPASLGDSLQTLFDDLFSSLGRAFGLPEKEGPVTQPEAPTARVSGNEGAVRPVPVEAVSTETAAPGSGAIPGDVVDVPQTPAPTDFGAGISDLLSSFLDRFASLVDELTNLFASEEVQKHEEESEEEHGNEALAPVPAESRPAPASFKFAIAAYASFQFDFSQELPESRLDTRA